MQKIHFSLLCAIVFLPTLFVLGQNPNNTVLFTAIMAAVTAIYLWLINHNDDIKNGLRSPMAFMVLVALQLAVCVVSKASPIYLLTPAAFIFAMATLRGSNLPWLQVNRFGLTLYGCLLMWPTPQSLMPSLGLFIFGLIILLNHMRIRPEEITARTFLLGLTAFAHPLLATLPAIMGFSLFATWPTRAVFIAIFGTALSAAILIYFPQSELTFANLRNLFTDIPSYVAAATLLAIVIIQSVYHWRWWPPHQHAAWLLGAITYILALAQLAQTESLAHWRNAPLLTLALPLIVYTLLRPTYKNK